MDDLNRKRIPHWLRWVAVLPGALIIGFLATFPLHWILYFTLAHGDTVSGVNILPIEHNLYPFVIAFVFIIAGGEIAPKYKFRTSAVLAILYAIFTIGVFLFASTSGIQPSLSPRALGPVAGILLGLFIIWGRFKEDQAASVESSTIA